MPSSVPDDATVSFCFLQEVRTASVSTWWISFSYEGGPIGEKACARERGIKAGWTVLVSIRDIQIYTFYIHRIVPIQTHPIIQSTGIKRLLKVSSALRVTLCNLHKSRSTKLLHNRTAPKLLEQPGQALLGHLLNLIILTLLLSMMLLATVLLSAMLLSAMLTTVLSTMLSRVPSIARSLRRRRHLMHITTLQIHKDPTLVLLSAILQSQFAAHLLNSRLDLLDVIPAVVALAHNDV